MQYLQNHSIWLRILSIVLEEELKVPDFVLWLNYYYFVLLDCFPLFLHFSLLQINLLFGAQGRPQFSLVQSLSCVCLFATPWTATRQASLSNSNSQNLLKLMSIELVMPSNHLILCRPLLPPSIFPSIRVFSNESVLCIRWPKYWSLSFSISPSNEYSGLISFRMDWFDLLAVQGTLKSLLQGTSMVVQWLRIMFPMPVAWVQSLVRDLDPYAAAKKKYRVLQPRLQERK